MIRSAARSVLRGRTLSLSKHQLFRYQHRTLSTTGSNLPFFDSQSTLLMGCVCYDPSVGDIWGGIKQYLVQEAQVPFDYVLFTNYQTQVKSLINGHIDIAWNGPIAHVMTEMACPPDVNVWSLGMRDVDRDFESIVVIRKDSGITNLVDLNGKVVYTGASDSPQAHVVPLHYLQTVQGIQFQSIVPHEYDLGKHGDTALGEIKVLEAMVTGDENSPVEVTVLSKMMWDRALAGSIPSVDASKLTSSWEVLENADLPKFDHCQFDALSSSDNEKLEAFGQALFDMDWNKPHHQRLLQLEGIQREWVQPRQPGYDVVRNALTARGGGGGSSSSSLQRVANNFPYSAGRRSFSTATTSTDNNTTTSTHHSPRVAVIGAGVAGIQALRALRDAGINATALETSDTVGGLWQSNYSNLGVQVVRSLYEFPDYPMTEIQPTDYATCSEVQSYTENYVDEFDLRPSIRFNTQVKSVQMQENDANQTSWMVETKNSKDGKTVSEVYDYLVVATGLFSNGNKFLPPVLEHQTNVLHSSDFCDASVANEKNVVVVGGGKSAVDCAIEASKAGASSVTLLQREPHWPTPRLIAGLIPFQYIFLSRFGQGLVSTYTGPLPETGLAVNAAHKSIVGPWLTKSIFRLVEELFAFQFDLKGKLRPKPGVVEDLYDVALILNDEYKDLKKAGKLNVKIGEISDVNDDTIQLKDGSTLEDVDLIVSATGFNRDYSIFDEQTRKDIGCANEDGLYLYRGIVPAKVPNLAFIGHMACISNILAYALQSEWLARRLTGIMETESSEAIQSEIEARKKWARSWMRPTKGRGMTMMLHQTHYYDQLLKDMGENPYRKMPNILAEMLMPYEPADYSGIIGDGKAVPAATKAGGTIQA